MLPAVALGDDASSKPSNPAAIDWSIPEAKSTPEPATSDVQSRIDELEATRSQLNDRTKPRVSVTVEGWVSQQVVRTIK